MESSFKSGDMIKLSVGAMSHFGLLSNAGILWEKLPREDYLEYDWKVFVDGRFIKLGRQIECNSERNDEIKN